MGHCRVIEKFSGRTSPLLRLVNLALLLSLSATLALAYEPPNIMLAEIYRQGIETRDYLVSEKLDGVRARWDGRRLISRGGQVFAAPDWFTKDFPCTSLDGELWMGRGRYEETASVVRKQQAHEGWRKIRLMIFDLPEHNGPFTERAREMSQLTTKVSSPYLAMIDQQTFESETDLQKTIGSRGHSRWRGPHVEPKSSPLDERAKPRLIEVETIR